MIRTAAQRSLVLVPLALALGLFAGPAARADEVSTSAIVAEVARPIALPEHGLAQFWWLPTEFWIAAAREVGQSPAEREEVRRIFQDYLLIGAMDVRLDETGVSSAASIAEIVERIEVWRGGEKLEVLREVNPKLVDRSPQLSYAFKTSLQPFGGALRVLPLANVDGTGTPIVSGARAGDLRLVYRAPEGGDPIEVRWRGPLTSVVGHSVCPEDGEKLSASFEFCPYHGKPLKPAGN